jgi:hypothetical protein
MFPEVSNFICKMMFLQAGHCNQDRNFKVDIKISKERERERERERGLVIS